MKVAPNKGEELEGWIQVEVTIECSRCPEVDGTMNEYDPETEFIERGWRATANHCYCPKCAKKYLKKKI